MASTAPLGQLQQAASWEFRCQREDERHLFLPLKDVCPFPVASRIQSLRAHQHIPHQLMDFPLLSRGKTRENNPKKQKLILLATCQLSLMGDCASGQGRCWQM